jgi:PEP-CTERM motif
MYNIRKIAVVAAMLVAPGEAGAGSVHISDFIPDATRTHFNDFETLPETSVLGAALSPYSNGGITVTQIGGGNDIWTTCTIASGCGGAHQDNRSWYPSSGDEAYTAITRTDGLDFIDMGLLVSSGYDGQSATYTYDLRLNGVQIVLGSISISAISTYLGFDGGGFDEVRLIATLGNPGISEITGGISQALQVDNIEASLRSIPAVPEPITLSLLGAGLVGIGMVRRLPVRSRGFASA